MKKAQMFGQIFTYIVAIIIVAFLLVFGYKAIFTFKEKANQVSLIQFRNDLTNTVDVISRDFGSVKVKEFTLPEGTKKVCFVNNFPELPQLRNTGYPLIEDAINSGVDKNVFLINDDVKESLKSGPIRTPEDFFCVTAIGTQITLRLEGEGDRAFISTVRE